MEIKYSKDELNKILNKLDQFAGKKAKQVFKNAFNRAGFTTRNKLIEDMPSIFKELNQYTRNSLYFKQLQINDDNFNGGSLEFKKKTSGSGVGAGIYLMPEEWGGSRMLNGLERKLKRMNLINEGSFAVPTKSFPKNLRNPASLQKLANDLGKGVTRVAKGRRSTKASFNRYFVIKVKSGSLEPGIYIREGRTVKRLFAYVDKVTYKQIFGFYSRAQRYFTQFFTEKINDELSKL